MAQKPLNDTAADAKRSPTIWKGKGPILYKLVIRSDPDSKNPIEKAFKYRFRTVAENEATVPEVDILADTYDGVIWNIASYIHQDRTRQFGDAFLRAPVISLDNTEVIDETANGEFHDISMPALFDSAQNIAAMPPPQGEPAYAAEITITGNNGINDVSIVYLGDEYINYSELASLGIESPKTVKFTDVPTKRVYDDIIKYFSSNQKVDVPATPANVKLIDFTDEKFSEKALRDEMARRMPPMPVFPSPVLTLQPPIPYAQTPYIAPQLQAQAPTRAYRNFVNVGGPIPGDILPNIEDITVGKRENVAIRSSGNANGGGKTIEADGKKGVADGEGTDLERTDKRTAKKQAKDTIKEGQIKNLRFFEPRFGFDEVIGMEYAKKFFHDNVILGLERPDLFAKYKKSIRNGFLLFGPPGTGKTYLVEALAKEAKMKLIVVRMHQLIDQYYGNTEKNIHKIFELAKKHEPCIIFFDEIDALGMSRHISRNIGSPTPGAALNTLLMEMDGIDRGDENIIIIGATNEPQDIDPALMRSGRFTNTLYIKPPDKKEREELFKFYANGRPAGDIDYERLANASEDFSPADIRATVDSAVTPLIAEAAKGLREENLSTDDLIEAITERRNRGGTVRKWYAGEAKVLENGGFGDELDPLYGDMINDIKKRFALKRRKKGKRDDHKRLRA